MSDELTTERAIIQTVVGLTLLLAGLAVLGLLFPTEMLAGSRAFVDVSGPWGVAAGVCLSDATGFPIPPDAYLAAGRLGGLPFWEVVAAGSAGSLLGGTIAYAGARYLSHTEWFERRQGAGVQRARRLFEAYGAYALALAAVSPLPYSLLAWASGGLGFPLRRFLLVSLLRIPRVAGYLFAIELGFVDRFI
ncbi:MAG: putative membrane protein YdjX (TVP38/TMEM64 family) [Myxococcota bacterium]|jgi:uncharacterized membrane protein YdjX (TVP38/TMEM64 family)